MAGAAFVLVAAFAAEGRAVREGVVFVAMLEEYTKC